MSEWVSERMKYRTELPTIFLLFLLLYNNPLDALTHAICDQKFYHLCLYIWIPSVPFRHFNVELMVVKQKAIF